MENKITTIAILAIAVPAIVFGADTSVVNNVSVSASTGDNTATSGEIKTGETKASVKVRTEINGEILENFEKEFFGDTNFEQEFKYATGTASTTTKVKVRTGSFPKSDLRENQVRLGETEMATTTRPARHFNEQISNWISKLFKNVFSIFKKK